MCVSSGTTLAALLVPIAVGMYFKRRWPNVAKRILKVGIICSLMHTGCVNNLLIESKVTFCTGLSIERFWTRF